MSRELDQRAVVERVGDADSPDEGVDGEFVVSLTILYQRRFFLLDLHRILYGD